MASVTVCLALGRFGGGVSSAFLVDSGQWPLIVARGQQAPRPLQQLLALFAQGSPLALPQLPSAARGGCYVTCAVLTSAKEKPGTVAGLAAYSAVKSKLSS